MQHPNDLTRAVGQRTITASVVNITRSKQDAHESAISYRLGIGAQRRVDPTRNTTRIDVNTVFGIMRNLNRYA